MLRMRVLVSAEHDGGAERGDTAQGHPPADGMRDAEGQVSVQGVPEQVHAVQEGDHEHAAMAAQWAVHALLVEPENVVDAVNDWLFGI